MTNRKRKLANARKNSSGAKHKPPTWRSYCPECRISDVAKPHLSTHVNVLNLLQRKPLGRCPNGHTWRTV